MPEPQPAASVPSGALSLAQFIESIRKPVNDLLKGRTFTVFGDVERITPWKEHAFVKLVEKVDRQTISLTVFVSSAVMRELGYELAEKQTVLVVGTASVGKNKNEFQLTADRIEDLGLGRMHRQIEEWRKEHQPIFDRPKKPLPLVVRNIAVISNSSIQGFEDFKKHLTYGKGVIFETKMQGEGVALGVSSAIEAANREGGFDLIVIARGGGSPVDLFEFSRPEILKAIAASNIPVATAVGHETDWPLCDSAADYRFSTPTHAGRELTERVERLRKKTEHSLKTLDGKVIATINLALSTVKRRRETIRLKALARIDALLQRTGHRKTQLDQARQHAEEQEVLRSKHRTMMMVAAAVIVVLLAVVIWLVVR